MHKLKGSSLELVREYAQSDEDRQQIGRTPLKNDIAKTSDLPGNLACIFSDVSKCRPK